MRYQPIAQIGRGGMAEVLLTLVDAGSGVRRLAVLKRIWPELASEAEFVTMFLDEARLSLRLSHPNVVQTHEVVSTNGELAIAMEYLHGQPLTRVLNRLLRGGGELPLPLRLRILTKVLAGLEYAHALNDLDGTPLGVVHRDVSPQNVFVTYDGQVKLVDFGVAKTLAASHHTRPGTLKGKLAYMAPEQVQRPTVDRRADLFAVGVMLWEMLACRRMWRGMTEVDILAHLAAGRPLPALPSDAGLPHGLDAICARALEPDPDRRYQTAADFEMELEGVLVGSADSHVRNLGKVVSMAFEAERAERQAIIDRCLRESGPMPVVTPATVVAEPPPDEDEEIDVTLSASERRAAARPVMPPEPAPAPPAVPAPAYSTRRLWLRRTAAVSGLLAAVAGLLVAVGWRPMMAVNADSLPAPAPATSGAFAPAPAAPPSAPLPLPPNPLTRLSGSPVVATDAVPDEPRHRRSRRHGRHADEDATLPPSVDVDP
jgi:hypothetical protein